ncbi:MAG: DUF3747 domain-containing protein [Coleofasciculus sp. Co-bin14]|nr:DUF3747 domain-containing protein [Coleofasciculus sp. Co-bin14]
MTNTKQWLQAALLATASFLTVGALSPTIAATFDNAEVKSDNFVLVAAPYGTNQHQLLIIEQISNKRPCWNESGNNPAMIEPLLLNFDFSGTCGRSTDSNGYSIRMKGEDLGLDYILRIEERNGDLVLLGSNRRDLTAPAIEIGRTGGNGNGFKKIVLNPGWRLTRRTYQGKPLGHVYITTDSNSPANPGSNTSTQPLPPLTRPLPPSTQPLPPLTQPLPPAERELIFTQPGTGSTTPGGQTPTTNPQPVTPAPQREIPVFVVPTKSQTQPMAPATSPRQLPSLTLPASTIPPVVVPTK